MDNYIGIFLKDLKGKPVRQGSVVYLDGIVLFPRKRISFKIGNVNYFIRQSTIKDLEAELSIHVPSPGTIIKMPTAILYIDFLGIEGREIQNNVEQAIAILRLFKVGEIKYYSYQMHSESITNVIAGTIFTRDQYASSDKGLITRKDAEKIIKFWKKISKVLPQSYYETGNQVVDHNTIAYTRYCDAILHNGVFERKIATVVMGLESLLLKQQENQELKYRLSIRLAKIFGLLGSDPADVRRIVEKAYGVRNLFVHGGHLSNKQKEKLAAQFNSIRNFQSSILEYLRISIILMLLIKQDKNKFIDLIDNSFIDKEKDAELSKVLKPNKDIIIMNVMKDI